MKKALKTAIISWWIRRKLKKSVEAIRKIVDECSDSFTMIFYQQTAVPPEYLEVEKGAVKFDGENPQNAGWIAARADEPKSIEKAIEFVLNYAPTCCWKVKAVPTYDLTPVKAMLFNSR